ncbi:sulfatase-like hydrolase/transferase [Paenibacillus oryzisoli]|uniref:sulfatase family protein n=1 Tax=Paenibacillus oryzisoli TaxID=1850517 RepID=UPI003D2AA62B
MTRKPNIIVITTDTQRCDTLRCMGSEFAFSPNLDRLAAEGVLFTQAHTASPVCSPARTSLLTGLHTHLHGCIENGIDRLANLPVFPDRLKEQGYYTIMVGKTHFGPVPDSFDVVHTAMEKGLDVQDSYATYLASFGMARTDEAIPEEHYLDRFLVSTAIAEIERAVRGEGQAERGSGQAELREGESESEQIEEQGRERAERPFFLYCSLVSPHDPVDPPGEWATLFDGVALPPLNYTPGEETAYPAYMRRLVGPLDEAERAYLGEAQAGYFDAHCGVERIGQAAIDQLRRRYYSLAAYCDAQIGRLLAYLDSAGLRENTLVIFSSDHGQEYFDHGFNNKHNYHDASWRVPLILSQPGTLPAGEKRDYAVWTDITATILGAAGAAVDAVQGFDLYAPLREGLPSPRRCAVGTLYRSAAVATDRWKLEYDFDEGVGRLYDRIADPREQCDVYGAAAYRQVRDALLHALLLWRAETVDVWHLKHHRHGGGPVARRLAFHTQSLQAADAERRLQERLQAMESLQPAAEA